HDSEQSRFAGSRLADHIEMRAAVAPTNAKEHTGVAVVCSCEVRDSVIWVLHEAEPTRSKRAGRDGDFGGSDRISDIARTSSALRDVTRRLSRETAKGKSRAAYSISTIACLIDLGRH